MSDTLSVTDNRTGKSYELAIENEDDSCGRPEADQARRG